MMNSIFTIIIFGVFWEEWDERQRGKIYVIWVRLVGTKLDEHTIYYNTIFSSHYDSVKRIILLQISIF